MGEQDVARLLSDPGGHPEPAEDRSGDQECRHVLGAEGLDGARAACTRSFHAYLLDLGAGTDLDAAADGLAQVFTHLGRTSALFFLFSAGWRPREMEGLAAVANG